METFPGYLKQALQPHSFCKDPHESAVLTAYLTVLCSPKRPFAIISGSPKITLLGFPYGSPSAAQLIFCCHFSIPCAPASQRTNPWSRLPGKPVQAGSTSRSKHGKGREPLSPPRRAVLSRAEPSRAALCRAVPHRPGACEHQSPPSARARFATAASIPAMRERWEQLLQTQPGNGGWFIPAETAAVSSNGRGARMRRVPSKRAAGMLYILAIFKRIAFRKCLRPREAGHFPCAAAWLQHPGGMQGFGCYINPMRLCFCMNLVVVEIRRAGTKPRKCQKNVLRGNAPIAFARCIASVNNVGLRKASSSASCFEPMADHNLFLPRCVCIECR